MVHICFDDETPPPEQIAVSSITSRFARYPSPDI